MAKRWAPFVTRTVQKLAVILLEGRERVEIAHLTETEKKTLHQFEEKLGMVLVAYQPEQKNSQDIHSEDTNASSSMQ